MVVEVMTHIWLSDFDILISSSASLFTLVLILVFSHIFIFCPSFLLVFLLLVLLVSLRPHPDTLSASPHRAVGVEVTAVSAVAERPDVRRSPWALLPPAGREAHVVPGDGRRQRVREFAGDAEAARDHVWWAVRVAVLEVGAERGQAAEALLFATAGTTEGEVAGSDSDGAAGLSVPLQEERARTSRTQLLLHHFTPGAQRETRFSWFQYSINQSINQSTSHLYRTITKKLCFSREDPLCFTSVWLKNLWVLIVGLIKKDFKNNFLKQYKQNDYLI